MKNITTFINESLDTDAIEVLAYKKHLSFDDIMDAFRKVVSEEDADDFAYEAAAWIGKDDEYDEFVNSNSGDKDIYDFIEDIYNDALTYEDNPGATFGKDLGGMLDSDAFKKLYNELK